MTIKSEIEEQIWKSITGYEQYYEISNLGSIKRLERRINTKNGKIQILKERISQPKAYGCDDYPTVWLTVNKQSKRFAVHRLVAEMFVPNPENKPIVNHIDRNKRNYQASNLAWCTQSENIRHAKVTVMTMQKSVSDIITYEDEVWKDIKDYKGMYQISNYGRIMSMDRYVKYQNSLKRYKMKIKKIYYYREYATVQLSKDGKKQYFRVNRLVAETFLENPDKKEYVNHINGLKWDNRLENLEWVTIKENNEHAINSGLRIMRKVNQYDLDAEFVAQHVSASEAARAVNNTCHEISRACKIFIISAGFQWRYADEEQHVQKIQKRILQFSLNGKFIRTFESLEINSQSSANFIPSFFM